MDKRYFCEAPVFDISENYDKNLITVVSTNLRCVNDGDKGKTNWFYRAPFLVKTIIAQKPDIIGCQECMATHYEYLTASLKGYGSFIDFRDDSDNPEACPVFYNTAKFELVKKGTFWLSKTPDRISKDWNSACYRICSFAILKQIKDGRELAVFNTHLDHVSQQARINGIKLILSKLEEFGGMPCVIMGDFNCYENSETYKAAAELFDDAKYRTDDTDSGATYQDFGKELGGENIDYFFISKTGIAVSQYKVIRTIYDGVYPSDHFPIRLKMNLI